MGSKSEKTNRGGLQDKKSDCEEVRINVSKNSMRECARAVITREEGCASRRKHETGTPSVTAAPSRPC